MGATVNRASRRAGTIFIHVVKVLLFLATLVTLYIAGAAFLANEVGTLGVFAFGCGFGTAFCIILLLERIEMAVNIMEEDYVADSGGSSYSGGVRGGAGASTE